MKYFLIFILCFQAYAITDNERFERSKVLSQFGTQEEESEEEADEANGKQAEQNEKSSSADTQVQQRPAQKAQLQNMEDSDTADLEELSGGKFSMPQMGDMPKLDPNELKKIMENLDKNPMFKMMNKKQKEAAAIMMKHNPFQNMKKTAIKSSINNMFKPDTQVGIFLKKNPKIADIIADIGVDKNALPSFMSILNQPEKMKTFGGVVIVVFVSVFFINLRNSKSNLLKRLIFKVCLIFCSAGVNLWAFYIIFKKELKPTVDIILRHL